MPGIWPSQEHDKVDKRLRQKPQWRRNIIRILCFSGRLLDKEKYSYEDEKVELVKKAV